MKKLYSVHEFAALAGVTVKALHHYDRVGLLKPRRTDAGHRRYLQRDLERLDQIVALKFLGLPLRQIKALLADARPLPEALRRQRELLQEKRHRLDRAIAAIEQAEANTGPIVVQTLLEVIAMQDDVSEMKKYFSDATWARAQQDYDAWPSGAWLEIFRDTQASLADDPSNPNPQRLAARWDAQFRADGAGDAMYRASLWRAWVDRDNWPASLKRRVEAFDLDRIWRFISEVSWANIGPDGQPRRTSPARAPDRASASRIALFRDIASALEHDPGGDALSASLARWQALVEEDSGGDPEVAASLRKGWTNRQRWPAGMKRYVASLYEMDADTWMKVADFLTAQSARSEMGDRAPSPFSPDI